MRAVVSNVFADDNRGGAAITIDTVATIRRAMPDAEITLLAVVADRDRARAGLRHTLDAHPDAEVLGAPFAASVGPLGGARAVLRSLAALARPARAARRNPALARIAESSLVVSKGGYVFVDRRTPGQLMSFWLTAFPIIFARRVGVPGVVMGATVGPFSSRIARAVVGLVLRSASLVLPRDDRSVACTRQLHVADDAIVPVPDIVLARTGPTPAASRARAAALGITPPFVVASVRAAGQRTQHVEHLAAVLDRLHDAGRCAQVVVVNQVHGGTVTDRPAAEDLAERLTGPAVRVLSDDLSPTELIELYGAADYVIGHRMHAVIFGLVAGTPAFGVVSDEPTKLAGVLETVGLEDLLVGHSSEPPDAVAERVIALLDSDVRARVGAALAMAAPRWEPVPSRLRALLAS